MAGDLWSAQYMAPGVLCAFAGASLPSDVPGPSAVATHAVRFRFGNAQVHAAVSSSLPLYLCSCAQQLSRGVPRHAWLLSQVADAFLGHAAVQESLAQGMDSGRCEGALSISFEGQVEAELEAVFCRGPEWDAGLEHLFLFQASPVRPKTWAMQRLHTAVQQCRAWVFAARQAPPDSSEEEVDGYLLDLAALAQSSLAGALQSTHGRVRCAGLWLRILAWSPMQSPLIACMQGASPCCVVVARSVSSMGAWKGTSPGCTHGMLCRFATKGQLQSFLRLPPCEALLANAGDVPMHAVLSFAYSIAPPAGSKNASPQSALL